MAVPKHTFFKMNKDLHFQIALTCIPQVGSVTARNLVSYCGSPEQVFRTSKKDLLKIPGIGPMVAGNISSPEPLQRAETELNWLEKQDVQAIFYTDEKFPNRLKQNADAPLMLFFKGSDVALLSGKRMLAIVGTRKPTDFGKVICEEIVENLAKFEVTVVSGLAFGIDVTAHKKCNQTGIPNIGVLGHGLGRLYPDVHRAVAEKMIENGGLLTEYPHFAPPDRENFPMRNRIIAGLTDALLVVETEKSGGSMISANLAFEYSREVFAVPGRVRDGKSAGCNWLIKSEKARLAETAEDIAFQMGWEENGQSRGVQTQLFLDLSDEETCIVEAVKNQPQIAIDELTFSTKLNPGKLASILLALEFKGVLRTLPGKRYLVIG